MAEGMSTKPADGVIMISLEIAPMKQESRLHRPTSTYVHSIHVSAPLAAHKFVTHSAITDLKLNASVGPASKASHEPQIVIVANSWQRVDRAVDDKV